MSTIKIKNGEINYIKFGNGNKKLVMIPGVSIKPVTNYADSIIEAYKKVADKYEIYLFDRLTNPRAKYSIKDMALDTLEAINKLGLNNFNLFGVSQGGMIALEMYLDSPNLICKLVLGSTSYIVDDINYKVIDLWVNLAKKWNNKDLYLKFCKDIYPKDFYDKYEKDFVLLSKTITKNDLEGFIRIAEATKNYNISKQLDNIKCKTYLIGSKDDKVFDYNMMVEMSNRIKNSKIYLYDTYGHAVFDMAPDFKERLLKYLDE